MQLSKVWGVWLLVLQLLNAIVGGLSFLIAVPDSGSPMLAAWKAKAVLIHVGAATAIGIMQAFAKSLTDADGDGVPDIFQGKP